MTISNIYNDMKPHPTSAALEVTLYCNMRCLHCASDTEGNPRPNEMQLSEWEHVVDELVEKGIEHFTISGGEPFAWPHWRELAIHIRRHGKALSIVSNGYLISDGDIAFLKAVGLRNIELLIDGTMKSHDKIHCTQGSFNRTMQVIRRFKQTPIKVYVTTSVSKINFNDLAELRTMLADARIDLWQIQAVKPSGRAETLKDDLIITPDQHVSLLDFIRESQQLKKSGKLNLTVMPADFIGHCHNEGNFIFGTAA